MVVRQGGVHEKTFACWCRSAGVDRVPSGRGFRAARWRNARRRWVWWLSRGCDRRWLPWGCDRRWLPWGCDRRWLRWGWGGWGLPWGGLRGWLGWGGGRRGLLWRAGRRVGL